MTDQEKVKVMFGEILEVDVIKKDENGAEYIEKETVRIKPIRQKSFVEAASFLNNNQLVDFVFLCLSGKTKEWVENQIEPKSFMLLFKKCVEINKEGFFEYIEEEKRKEEQNLERYNRIASIIPEGRLEKFAAAGSKLTPTK